MPGIRIIGLEGHRKKRFFFEKKNQKTSMNLGLGLWRRQSPWPGLISVFCAIFYKKALFS
jgi:hypothetical protein